MTTYTASFNDITIDEMPNRTFTGLAAIEYDDVWGQFFCKTIELFGVLGPRTNIIIKRRNRDQRLDVIFNQLEDVLIPNAPSVKHIPSHQYSAEYAFG